MAAFISAGASRVELFLGGQWVNVTGDVYARSRVRLTRGRSDEASQPDPAECVFTLRDPDGRYSPRNPTGPYYGELGRNTPVRTYIHAADIIALVADTDSVTCPDAAALDITGDIDVRVDARMPSWRSQRGLAAKYEITGNQRSWAFYVEVDGHLWLLWSPDGTLGSRLSARSTLPVPVTVGRLAVRAALDVNNGSGNHTVTFYTADTIAGSWTQLGAPWTPAGGDTTSVHSGTAPVELGDVSDLALDGGVDGRIYSFELRDGIGGTVVASPDFTAQTEGATSFDDAQANTWTVQGGAEITSRWDRFIGEVAALQHGWEDQERNVTVEVTANGVSRRIGASDTIQSALRRGVLADAQGLFAYWPVEDDQDATSIAAALDHQPMQAASGMVEFAAYTGFDCSKPVAVMNDAEYRGRTPFYDLSTGQVQLRMLLHIPEATTTENVVKLQTTGQTCAAVTVAVEGGTGGDLRVRMFDDDGLIIEDSGFQGFNIDGRHVLLSVELTQNGGNIDYTLAVLEPGAAAAQTFSDTVVGARFERCYAVAVNVNGGLTDTAFGHIFLQSQTTSLTELSEQLAAFAGETAGARFQRLCAHYGVASRVIGDPDDTTLMGPQQPGQLLDLLRETADTDGGILYETREELGLTYRTRTSLYRQSPAFEVDCCDGALAGPLLPVDDDQRVANDVTVTRQAGSSSRAVLETGNLSVLPPPAGVGRYQAETSVNVFTDAQLPDHAHWRLHLGTVDEPRFPQVDVTPVNPVVRDDSRLLSDLLGMDIGDRLVVTGPPSWLRPEQIDQLMQGQSEEYADLGDGVYDVGLVCQPQTPYQVAVTTDTPAGVHRFAPTAAVLDTGVNTTATTLLVEPAGGRDVLWTTDNNEFPLLIVVEGERMVVTDIAGGSAPQTFTVTRSDNGVVKSHPAGARVELVDVPVRAL